MQAGRLFALVAMLVAAVSVAPGCNSKPVTCSPNGTALSLIADSFRFDTNCLAAPANQPFAVTLTNKDGVYHNVLISVAFNPSAKVLFKGDSIKGPGSVTYQVAGLQPGTYSFECSIHPAEMHGTFIVH